MKVAFLFPGQGAQKVGMGAALAHEFEPARRVFEEADHALGFALSALCFEGPEEELRLTVNTQPAILAPRSLHFGFSKLNALFHPSALRVIVWGNTVHS
jgi:malonyl CoA-acyl carrier protein transacylase